MPKDGVTGGLLEYQYFGALELTTEAQLLAAKKIYQQLSGRAMKNQADGRPPRLPFDEAVAFAKGLQPWDDPTMPEKKVAKDLLNFVADELGIEEDSEDEQELKFYTAVGGKKSPLDFYHGVDAFIEFRGTRVLIDVTKNPSKRFEDSNYDRIIMEELPDYGDKKQKSAYEEELRKYARAVAFSIRQQESSSETHRAYQMRVA